MLSVLGQRLDEPQSPETLCQFRATSPRTRPDPSGSIDLDPSDLLALDCPPVFTLCSRRSKVCDSRASLEEAFLIVTIYIDESGTHDSGVTILGGWVGRLGQWAKFDPQWKRLLKRNRLTCFHSKEMRHTQGEFRGWKVHQKQNFIEKAAKIGLKNLEFGFTIILGDDDYQKYYIAGYRPKEVPLDSRYGLCFRYCLGIVPAFAKESFADSDIEINFVLETGHRNIGDAHRIFKRVRASRMANEQERCLKP
jgi:hypothetical protein